MQVAFGDLVVVVKKLARFGQGIAVVDFGRQLVGVLWRLLVSRFLSNAEDAVVLGRE